MDSRKLFLNPLIHRSSFAACRGLSSPVPPEQVLSVFLIKVFQNTQMTLNSCCSAGFVAYLAALANPSASYITLLLQREIPTMGK